MNTSRLSIAVLTTLFSMSATAALTATVDANKSAAKATEPHVVEMNTETFVSNDAGVFVALAGDMAMPSQLSLMSDIDTIVSTSLSEVFAGLPAYSTSNIIKNAPYSAEVVSERVQMLADGNQIIRRTSQMSYRDSAGRTRTEVRNADGAPRNINIFDAFEGSRYILNPSTKSATKLNLDANIQQRVEAMREKAKSAIKNLKSSVIEGGTPREKVIIHRVESMRDSGIEGGPDDIKINVIRSDGSEPMSIKSGSSHMPFNGKKSSLSIGGANPDIMSSALGAHFQDRAWSSKATTKELGFKDFNGVRAEGKLTSYIIPAGEIGNKNAITVSTETWISPELQITVYSKHSDPRTGENIYRLTNISRNEQPMALFTVPDGYSVKAVQMPSFTEKSK